MGSLLCSPRRSRKIKTGLQAVKESIINLSIYINPQPEKRRKSEPPELYPAANLPTRDNDEHVAKRSKQASDDGT